MPLQTRIDTEIVNQSQTIPLKVIQAKAIYPNVVSQPFSSLTETQKFYIWVEVFD